MRKGFSIGADGSAIFSERRNGRSGIMSVLRQQSRRIVEVEPEIEELRTLAKPLRGRSVHLINSTAVGGGVTEIFAGVAERDLRFTGG